MLSLSCYLSLRPSCAVAMRKEYHFLLISFGIPTDVLPTTNRPLYIVKKFGTFIGGVVDRIALGSIARDPRIKSRQNRSISLSKSLVINGQAPNAAYPFVLEN